MKRMMAIVLALFGGTLGCGTGGDDVGLIGAAHGAEENPPALCRVTGGGRILAGDSPDSLGGNAQWFRGTVFGEWNHLTHEGQHFHGDPDYIECFELQNDEEPPEAGAAGIWFSGTGSYDGDDDCTFAVYIEDHGEPEEDYYWISISCTGGASYTTGDWLYDGNLQIHAIPPGHMPR